MPTNVMVSTMVPWVVRNGFRPSTVTSGVFDARQLGDRTEAEDFDDAEDLLAFLQEPEQEA